jgi:hypothetical protein
MAKVIFIVPFYLNPLYFHYEDIKSMFYLQACAVFFNVFFVNSMVTCVRAMLSYYIFWEIIVVFSKCCYFVVVVLSCPVLLSPAAKLAWPEKRIAIENERHQYQYQYQYQKPIPEIL